MSIKRLTLSGLTYFWSRIKGKLATKQDKLVCHTDNYTPSQILALMQAGQHVILTANSMYFQDVAYSSGTNNIYASCCTIYNGSYIVIFMVGDTSTDTWTLQFGNLQPVTDKVSDIVGNSASTTAYPNTKAVYSQFQRKPVVVWEAASASDGILAAGAEVAESPTWQLTGLDMTPFSRVKCYIRSGSTGSSTTASICIEIDLDDMNKSDYGHFIGSAVVQNPNNRNRLFLAALTISEDKTSVLFNRETSLYGTAATGANDSGRILYKIVGYYD